MKIEELEQIIKILKQNEVNEFEFDNDGVRIRLSRGSAVVAQASMPNNYNQHQYMNQNSGYAGGYNVDIQPVINAPLVAPNPEKLEKEAEMPAHFYKVESPIVGTFYRKPSPDSPAFVSEGDKVTKGQTLCIIEAMKLMNEIEAPISGKIEKVVVTDSQVVEFGEVLFLIDPSA